MNQYRCFMRICSTENCGKKHHSKGLCLSCYSASRKEQRAAYNRAYYLANGEACRAQARQWAKDNPERKSVGDRARREADPEKARKKDLRYYEANRARVNARNRDYYWANRERALKNAAAWQKANAEKIRSYEQKRRAVVQGAGTYSPEEWFSVLEAYGHVCPGCGTSDGLTVDHIIPLSKGGANTADNLQPLCGSCNASKGNRHSTRYAPWAAAAEIE